MKTTVTEDFLAHMVNENRNFDTKTRDGSNERSREDFTDDDATKDIDKDGNVNVRTIFI